MAIYFGQDIDTKLGIADVYYGVTSHIRANDWAAFSENEQKAALTQAEREVDLYLGVNLEENYDDTSFPVDWNLNFRPDYAIFEHALFILDNTARTKTGTDGAQLIESEEYQEEEAVSGVGLSPQASRFLTLNRIQIERG